MGIIRLISEKSFKNMKKLFEVYELWRMVDVELFQVLQHVFLNIDH